MIEKYINLTGTDNYNISNVLYSGSYKNYSSVQIPTGLFIKEADSDHNTNVENIILAGNIVDNSGGNVHLYVPTNATVNGTDTYNNLYSLIKADNS